jgi:methanethiol S-methyltransferase
MTHADYGYGLWGLALVNAAVFILFAFSFFKPATRRDWRSFGAFSAFIVALFAEMYGGHSVEGTLNSAKGEQPRNA